MENNWYMLTLVGKDQPGIVAKITSELFKAGGQLGEASMIRLGGNFTIMLMLHTSQSQQQILDQISPVTALLSLHCHIDKIDGHLHDHRIPDVRISVYGADRPGIVSQITTVLADAGLDIFDLESDVAGTGDKPIYIMHIEGHAANGLDALQKELDDHIADDVKVQLDSIDTLIG